MKKYLNYYFKSIFYKLKYVEHEIIKDEDGEESEDYSGYILSQRRISWLIISPFLLCFYFVYAFWTAIFVAFIKTFQPRDYSWRKIICGDKKISKEKKITFLNRLTRE